MDLCSACGSENRSGAKFCAECGAALAATCSACGSTGETGKFCSECGAPLPGASVHADGAPTASAKPGDTQPVAERRMVSMLFADLVGFTPLSESRDPEAVRELLSAYFERAREVIERYGGVVEKFIGDAVFAVFGVPAAREDDAERAVRAGLDLVSTVIALGEEKQIPDLQMRVGVTTGTVAVTLGAVGEGMVAGDAVNTAARVQSVAAPGQVWVDDTTRSLTTASLAYTPTGAHELKGKAVPVALFHATRTTAALGGEQRVDGLEAPFVGRDRELRLIKELFHGTAEDGRPRLVLVAGEPGIGKSRLAWEFEKYADAIRSQTTHWLRGRCLSYGSGIAGRVVADMVRSLLRVTETDDDATVEAALDERLARHVSDEAERVVLRPRLASLLGLSNATFDQADLFACWRRFLESLTESGESVTVVVEDLQWADDGFLDFVEHVLDAAKSPIMILALARPEVQQRRSGIGAGRRSTTVYLEPLPPAAMQRLLDGLVGELPDALRDELVRRAEGVPLYAVETVRALIDRDVIVPRDGRYVVDPDAASAIDLEALGPPASLQALLGARLDALTDDERRVVQDAAVLGLTFTRAAIESLTPSTIDLDAVLESLRRKEIVTVDTDPRSPERGQYRFVQALLRGVAYDTLSRRDRRARHIAVAAHIETWPDLDAIAAVVATHYLDALAAVPDADDAEELRTRAAVLLESAAAHAATVGAAGDALVHYGRLLDLGVDEATVVRVTLAASVLARNASSRLDDAVRWVATGIETAQRIGDEDSRLMLVIEQSLIRLTQNRAAEVVTDLQAVVDASIDMPQRVTHLAEAVRGLALCAQALADPQLAQDSAIRAMAPVERFADDEAFAAYLQSLSVWFGLAGYRRLNLLVRQAAAESTSLDDPRGIRAWQNVAAGVLCDDPAQALEACQRTQTKIERLGHVALLIPYTCNRAAAEYLLGRWDAAAQHLAEQQARGVTSRFDWESYVAALSALLAWGRHDPSLLIAAVDDAKSTVDPVAAGWWLMREAVVTALDGDVTGGAELAARAVERMHDLGPAHEDMPPCFALAVDLLLEAGGRDRLAALTAQLEQVALGQRYRLLHGTLLRAAAHLSDEPVGGLRAAVDVFAAMGALYPEAQARVELAEALAAAGDMPSAQAALDVAEPVLREMGAPRLLERLDRIRMAPVGAST